MGMGRAERRGKERGRGRDRDRGSCKSGGRARSRGRVRADVASWEDAGGTEEREREGLPAKERRK